MSTARMTDELLVLVAERFKALGDGGRLQLLQALRAGPRTVSDLVDDTGLGQANVSRHLAMLHASGFVSRERDGAFVRYSLADREVLRLCDVVCGRLEAEVEARRKLVEGRLRRAPGRTHARGHRACVFASVCASACALMECSRTRRVCPGSAPMGRTA